MNDRLVVRRGRQKGSSFPLSRSRPLTLGRSPQADIQLTDESVSREHAAIEWLREREGYQLRDLGSAAGTFLRRKRKRVKQVLLRAGQRFRLGRAELELDIGAPTDVPAQIPLIETGGEPGDSGITRLIDFPVETDLLSRIDAGAEAQEIQRLKDRLEILYRVSNLVNTEEDPATLHRMILAMLADSLHAERGFLFRYDPDRRSATAIATWIGLIDPKTQNLPVSRRILFNAFTRSLSAYQPDVNASASPQAKPELREVICAPVASRERILGALYLDATAGTSGFEPDDMETLTAVGRQFGMALARLESAQEVRRLKEFNEDVVGTIPVGLVVLDPQDRVLTSNRAFVAMLDDPEAPVQGRVIGEVFSLDAASAETFAAGLAKVRKRGSAADLRDLRTPPDANPQRRLRVHLQAMDEPGVPRRALVLVEDVTEQARLQLQVLQSERMASVGALAAGVAHEFNNIMAAILGYAQLAKKDDAFRSRLVDVTLEQAERAAKIVSGLMTFSRQRDRTREPTDVTMVLKSVVQLVEREAEFNGIALKRRFRKASPVRADPVQIQQVALNLVINAIHAVGRSGTVTLSCGDAPAPKDGGRGEVIIAVHDDGPGIPPHVLPRVFDPFFTTKGALGKGGSVPGTGLGLSVSYNIIQDHGGRIEVDSREGEGTTFTVHLPCATEEQMSAGTQTWEAPHARVAGRHRVLVVEDEASLRELLGAVLSEHRVFAAANGREALDVADRERIDVVLLDVHLEGAMDGFEVFARLRESHPHVKVVLLTGRLNDAKLQEAVEQADGYLRKPFNIQDVHRALAACGLEVEA